MKLILVAAVVLGMAGVSQGQSTFKMIHQPGGGEIAYGAVPNQSTLPGTMGAVLRQVHGKFGEKPQVTRFFRTKGSNDTVATFFTVTAKNDGGKQIAGLALAAMPGGQGATGAVIYDDAKHFTTSMGPLMKKLNEVWNTSAAKGTGAVAGHVKPLHVTAFPDNSGSIGLPDGWKITAAQQGVMHATGPNNESVHIGVYVPVMDPTNPQQRQMIQMETRGGQAPLPGMYVAVPYGTEPLSMLQDISKQLHAKQHLPPAGIELIDSKDQGNGCRLFNIHLDDHDGKGRMYSSINMCVTKPFTPGMYGVSINQVVLPENLLADEQPTLVAMFQSYKTNDQVINACLLYTSDAADE